MHRNAYAAKLDFNNEDIEGDYAKRRIGIFCPLVMALCM